MGGAPGIWEELLVYGRSSWHRGGAPGVGAICLKLCECIVVASLYGNKVDLIEIKVDLIEIKVD